MNKLHYRQALAKLLAITTCIYSGITAATENNLAKEQLTSQAQQYVLTQLDPDNTKTIDVAAMAIDKRILIPNCQSGFTFSASPDSLNQTNVTVKALCKENSWYMFMVVKAIETQSVVVLSSTVSPGTLLTTSNIQVVSMNKKRLRSSTFADIEDVLGARIKRRASAGRPVDPNNLCYVCKGDRVTISAGTPSMQVKTSGVALEDGRMGETIEVKNRRSSKKVYGRVTSTGQVEISI